MFAALGAVFSAAHQANRLSSKLSNAATIGAALTNAPQEFSGRASFKSLCTTVSVVIQVRFPYTRIPQSSNVYRQFFRSGPWLR